MSMCRNDPADADVSQKIDTRTLSLDQHRALFKTPPVSYTRGAVATVLAPTLADPCAPADRKRQAPQRATRLKAAAAEAMRGRDFTSNDLATALGKGRRQATAVLNSWVGVGLVVRAGTRKESSGQTSTMWRLAPECSPSQGATKAPVGGEE